MRSRTKSGPSLTNGDMATRSHSTAHRTHERNNSTRLKAAKGQSSREAGLLQATQAKAIRREGSDLSGGGSESDSLLDLYGNQATHRAGATMTYRGNGSGPNGDVYIDDEDPESSRWIHRDKLARIEIEEMQRAGIYVGPISRTSSKPPERREREGPPPTAARQENEQPLPPADASAAVPDATRERNEGRDGGEEGHEEPISFELRRPEEVAADALERVGRSASNRPLVRKPSWSKIPLSKSSPIPVPQDYIEKHTPTPRSRSGPWGSVDENSIEYTKTRHRRSQSVGSQNLLDDHVEGGRSSPTPGPRPAAQGTPSEVRPAGRRPSSSNGTKALGSRDGSGQHKPRARPGPAKDSPGQRPATRSGETPPKGPINRPEGDPPWLATMYKPDPRLPPEQQLIPTVAKRLKREQWEREGKRVSAAELGLEPVRLDEGQTPEAETAPALVREPATEPPRAEWPLTSPANPRPELEKRRSDLSAQRPRPSTEQRPPEPAPERTPSTQPPLQPIRVQQQPPLDEDKEAKGGCRCCVVM